MHKYLYLGGRIVVYTFGLDFSLFDGSENRVDQRCCALAERDFTNGERLAVELLYLGTYLKRSAPLSVVISSCVDQSACREVGIKPERLSFEIVNRRLTDFFHVVGQNFRTQSYGNTLGPLC